MCLRKEVTRWTLCVMNVETRSVLLSTVQLFKQNCESFYSSKRLVWTPPSGVSGVAPVAPAPPSSVTLVATNSNGSTTFNLANNDDKFRQQNFIPAQQYTPYNTLGGGILNPDSNLPSYQPGNRIPATWVSFIKVFKISPFLWL